MTEAKDAHQHFSRALRKIFSGGCQPLRRHPNGSRELDCLLDRQSGEVHVVFRTVVDISTELGKDVLGSKGIVVYRTRNGVILVALVGKGFEKCATA